LNIRYGVNIVIDRFEVDKLPISSRGIAENAENVIKIQQGKIDA